VEGLWALLAGAGGTLALCFIILVAAGIAAMTLLFMGSAVVVLERFARVARSWAWIATFTVAVALCCAAIRVDVSAPELSARPWKEWLERFSGEAAWCVLIAAVAVLVCRLLVWRLSSARLGRVVLALFGLVVALFLVVGALPELQADLVALGANVLGVFFAVVIFGLLPLAAAGLVEMRRSVEWFIAARYLVAKRRQVFISAITAICVGGIAAGVWLIIIVLSVMNGFEATWRNEILGNRAHFTVHSSFGPFPEYERVLEEVRSVPEVVAASPYIDVDGMVRGRAGEIFSVRVRGIDPASVDGVTDLRSDLILGSLDALVAPGNGAGSPPEQDGREGSDGDPGIVIGNQLALSVGAAVGDSLLLISPFGGPPTPLGPAPRLKRFRVVGVFESSFFQYDEVYTYVSIPAAQEFRRSGPVIDGIEARTTDYYRSRRVGQAVEEVLDSSFYTRDWKEFFPAFFQALKTERVMMFMLLTMIMVVAAFLIVATLIMMIMEKSSDIAILKAMGAEDATIERIFAIEGTLIGLVGTVLGVAAGIAVTRQLAWIQERIEAVTGIDTLPASVYQFSTLPSEVDPTQVALVATIAMVLSLGATLLPSRQGAKVDPAEGLRYE
jgi:lipoprotein-releasing system permease protein